MVLVPVDPGECTEKEGNGKLDSPQSTTLTRDASCYLVLLVLPRSCYFSPRNGEAGQIISSCVELHIIIKIDETFVYSEHEPTKVRLDFHPFSKFSQREPPF